MKVVVQLKLEPDAAQATVLERTLHALNAQANRVSAIAHRQRTFRNFALRKLVYAEVRDAGIGSQAAQHLIKKVADAYVALRANIRAGKLGAPGSKRRRKAESKPITFRSNAAQPYDRRNLSFALGIKTISLWTLDGRLKGVPFVCSPRVIKMLGVHKRGETDLLYRDGIWYLMVSLDVPEPAMYEPVAFLGVDLGIVNIATTSDGEIMAGRKLNRYRRRQLRLRAKLQRKGTKSAKRLLRKRSRREGRRAKDINHCISKTIVAKAERTGRGISLEDLTGIRERVRHRKPGRAALHSWAFYQLGEFIVYKARRAGVPVVHVDPAYTSQTCAECGHCCPENRATQELFACRSCGLVQHADRNASRNIAQRGAVVWDAGRKSHVPATQASV